MPAGNADLEFVREVLLAHPTVREGTIHGAPSFKSGSRIIACSAIHKSADPDSLVVSLDKSQRAARIAGDPAALYVVDHYANYDVVLVRLSIIGRKSLRELLNGAVAFVGSGPLRKRPRVKRAVAKRRSTAGQAGGRGPRRRQ